MLIKRTQLEAIVRGEIRIAFRRWKRPTVKTGGSLKTALGVLAIDAVDRVTMKSLTEADAHASGFESRATLLEELQSREGLVYRIRLHYVGDDPRILLRRQGTLSSEERATLEEKLARFDRYSNLGPWTSRVLRCISKRPAVRAADLAEALGYEKAWFKNNVRKLKALGLTESLEVGYRLSPRGRALLGR